MAETGDKKGKDKVKEKFMEKKRNENKEKSKNNKNKKVAENVQFVIKPRVASVTEANDSSAKVNVIKDKDFDRNVKFSAPVVDRNVKLSASVVEEKIVQYPITLIDSSLVLQSVALEKCSNLRVIGVIGSDEKLSQNYILSLLPKSFVCNNSLHTESFVGSKLYFSESSVFIDVLVSFVLFILFLN